MTNAFGRRDLLRMALAASAGTILPAKISLAAQAAAAQLPNDRRLGDLKDLNGYFPFTPPETPEAWEKRAEYVRRQIRVACGLWPMPERPPVSATVHGRVEREGYTVDRVFFESSPGLLVTGSLYRPAEITGPIPTILCPHGHWAEGRFHDHGDDQIKRELESGGEVDPIGGRHPLQARSVQLARMGCMVFLYDMLGYADGSSLSYELAHRFAKQRPGMSSPDHFGLFSAQAELRCLNALGLQTWNSIRTLDWILSREDCDPSRVGVTGASGGGTQTFILTSIDERVKAAFPAVMVSTAMQGGCTCENASLLRINTGNIEFAALAAPRPLAMTGADDWTVDIETKGLPQLRQLYRMLGAEDAVSGQYLKFPHNYNLRSRMLMYNFFNSAFELGFDSIAETTYQPLSREEATVFGDQHPAPDKSEAAEALLMRNLATAADLQFRKLIPENRDQLDQYRSVVAGALEVMVGRSTPSAGSTTWEATEKKTLPNGSMLFRGPLGHPSEGEELPMTWLLPPDWNSQAVLWFDGQGSSQIFSDGTEKPIVAVQNLLNKGFAVGSADLFLTGAFTADGKPVTETRVVANPREFAGYTLGYNHPLFSQRVHDMLTVISHTVNNEKSPQAVHIIARNGAGPHAACAAVIAAEHLKSLVIDTDGFRFSQITNIRDVNLLPGALRYGDLPGMLAAAAPSAISLAGETQQSCSIAIRAWQAAGATLNLLADNSPEALANQIILASG